VGGTRDWVGGTLKNLLRAALGVCLLSMLVITAAADVIRWEAVARSVLTPAYSPRSMPGRGGPR
jgi:hypothetical protein